ncbi:MAG TPA: DUF6492 family protein, partial [Rhizobiaceae bacterium]|nr:DUF6492 family protein [Rhizobiaceae bacterium]
MMTSKPSLRRNALVTASYAPDLERCRILCESIDRYASGYETHYILVENRDLPLFRALEGGKRKVIGERDILPFWLKRFSDPTRKGASVWLSPFTKPLHGWHVQQLRRIALAAIAEEDALIYCDSDTAMIRAYDFSGFWRGDALRLYRQENGADHAQSDHKIWMHHAAE